MAVAMNVFRLSLVTGLVVSLVNPVPSAAQTSALAEKAARVQEMRANMPTQAQREAAAAELKAFKLKIQQARTQALKAGLTRPASAQLPPGVGPIGPLDFPDYYTTSNWAFSPPIRKFVDTLPGLTAAGANNRNVYIPVATPDTLTYPGSDYYEIAVRQYEQSFHTDLPPTTLRGYVQTNLGTDEFLANTVVPAGISYLGPLIVSQRDRPVRIKFTNELPFGQGGDLFVPVDQSIMGAGKGPLFTDGSACDPSPVQSVPPGNATEGQNCARYTQNRAAIHLHGGRTPWISDGTPHQWIIPALEWPNTPYDEGVSLENVPDMPNPGPGSTTYYFSNQQSARLMFYHDHAWGITRLNVLVGMAAGYLITDQYEQGLVDSGVIPADQIPLIIQDRTFVDASDIRTNDPTWNWGTGLLNTETGVREPKTGDLWVPHVYIPAQNPYDPTGTNPYGRWVYGPWFFPPTNNILHNVVPNPYHDPACTDPDPAVYAFCTTPGQPPMVPGTPHPSIGAESFFDTAVVNGQAFPSLTVEPKAYRFRILNAANDRFWNLNFYKADPAQVSHDGRAGTEVRMVPADGNWDTAAYPGWPSDGRVEGVPDPTTQGPKFIQIGTEGGFLPRPVVRDLQPITWVGDPTFFNAGNIDTFGLFMGPAERADVIVDFSQYAGQTLILYNDAPAAVPAFDARHDYLAGAPDLSDTGGYGRPAPWDPTGPKQGPQIGYGPNTRTIMQVKVAAAPVGPPPAPFNLAALEAAFAPDPGTSTLGLFEAAQDPIIVGQDAYNGVYTGVTFPQVWPYWGFSRIEDNALPVFTVGGTYQTFPMEPKGIHDEMGAAFDMEYGRMGGQLGIANPAAGIGLLNFTLYRFPDPATEVLNANLQPGSPVLGDGTQLWKISHNGVDMHPIHFHIFDVQVVNRVGWDGMIRPPDPSELGWKDTVRIAPLEDTIVAMRPWAPKVPFGVPDSLRPLNPAIPLNSPYGFTNIDPITQQPKAPLDVNRVENFGWEYVWHCHILSHEENDMMRPIIINVVSEVPGAPSAFAVDATGPSPVLSWVDATPVDYLTQSNFGNPANEIAFRIERTGDPGSPTTVAFAQANAETFTDTTAVADNYYRYRVVAYNEAGEAASAAVEIGLPASSTAASAVNLTASPASGYVRGLPGLPVVFTAQGVGGSGYEYRFWLDGVEVQGYGPGNTFTLPVTQPAGTYLVDVDVRTNAASLTPDASSSLPYVLDVPAPATLALAAAPATSPVFFGTPVVFTAGPVIVGAEYRFWLNWLEGGTGFGTTPVQDWSGTLNTYTLPASTPPGTYTVRAEVRTTASAVDATSELTTAVVYRPATTLTLRASRATPFPVTVPPTPVTFLAMGGGSTGTPSLGYLYRFSLSTDGTNFTEVLPYGTVKLWTLPPDTAPGSYTLKAEVKTNLAAATADREAVFPFVVQNAPEASAVTLTADKTSPQPLNSAVIFTAAGQGSVGYQYRFLLNTNGAGFLEVQPFSPVATWTLPATTPEGSYQVKAEVKANPTSVAAEAESLPFPMVIRAVAAPSSVALTADRASPATVNIVPLATVFTAAPAGSPGPFQYRFSLSTNAGAPVVVQDYPGTSTWTMPASTPAGSYVVTVDVRTSAFVDFDATSSIPFELQAAAVASSVTLTASLDSPQAPGTAVTFTAAGQGSSGYQYRFLLNTNGGGFLEVQPFGPLATWTLPTTTPEGQYQVQAEVMASPTSTVAEATSAPVAMFLRAVAAPNSVGLTANRSSPAAVNIVPLATVFTAAPVGTGPFEYRFSLSTNSGPFVVVQDYPGTSTWTMPASTPIGNYSVKVDVRTSTFVDLDVSNTMAFQLVAPAPAASLSVATSVPSPSNVGTAVIFTATATGSNGYQFKFYLFDGTTWTVPQDWSSANAWTMPADTAAGSYRVDVQVRTTTTVAYDRTATRTHNRRLPPATGVTLSAQPMSSQVFGSTALFTASGQGSSGYSYQFWLFNGSTWTMVRDWSSTATYTLPATTPVGSYRVDVKVRTSTLVASDATATLAYAVLVAPATGLTVTTNVSSPKPVGTLVTFKATGSGGSGTYSYRFWLFDGTTWTVGQDWGTNDTYTLPTGTAGSYRVDVQVRTSALVSYDKATTRFFTIQ